MIDTFIPSSETKWNCAHGLVMILPHGYDGNGSEHSSARVERWLQLTDAPDEYPPDDVTDRDIIKHHNMRVVNCTTAAQYFHILRSQMRRTFRKPLCIIAPKRMLKLRAAASELEDFD